MPLYEYECPNGHRTEKFLSLAEADKRIKCPQCGKRTERVFSRTGAPILKEGVGGFYSPTKVPPNA